VPPSFVLALLISALLILIPVIRPLSMVIPLAYIIANFGASLLTAFKRGWRSLPLLPIIFSILHLSYGLGFLVGLARFANRWRDKQSATPAFVNQDASLSEH
jgi:succinoglycan biosynthesis protein ExoA